MIGSLIAGPPHPLGCARDHICWCQIPVLGRMPLRGNLREQRLKTVGHRKLVVGAERATDSLTCSASHCRGPFVVGSPVANPPNLSRRPRDYLVWGQFTVLGRMPLGRDLRGLGGKAVCEGDLLASAIRTAMPSNTPVYWSRPFMVGALIADPPNHFLRARVHIGGCQLAVPGRMPLRRHIRKQISQRLTRSRDSRRHTPSLPQRHNNPQTHTVS